MKKFILLLSYFLFSFFLLNGCGKQTATKYCDNEVELFSPDDSIKVIKIPYNIPSEEIIKYLEIELNEDLCWNKINFGLKLKSEREVSVFGFRKCPEEKIICMRRFPELRILLNAQGKILVNYEKVSFDSR